jgi:hypothetical protein
MSRKPSIPHQLLVPGAPVPTVGEPKQSAVIIQTENGEKLAFPQVAVAMVSPDVIRVIAEAVWQRTNNPAAFFAEFNPKEEAAPEVSLEEDSGLVKAG